MTTAQLTFEQAQRELEEIVGRLERGDVPIDDALALWRRGEELYRRCTDLLEAAEGRIEELARTAAEAEGGGSEPGRGGAAEEGSGA